MGTEHSRHGSSMPARGIYAIRSVRRSPSLARAGAFLGRLAGGVQRCGSGSDRPPLQPCPDLPSVSFRRAWTGKGGGVLAGPHEVVWART